MVESVFVGPVRPTRKYYVAEPNSEIAASPRAQTNDSFGANDLTENVRVFQDADWNADLHEHMVMKAR